MMRDDGEWELVCAARVKVSNGDVKGSKTANVLSRA